MLSISWLTYALLITVPKCGKQLENSIVPLIEKGDAVSLGDFPWVTAIYDKTIKNHLICSGSIITPYAVLSGK